MSYHLPQFILPFATITSPHSLNRPVPQGVTTGLRSTFAWK